MKTINDYRKRFNQLIESTIGDVKPLLNETSGINSVELMSSLKDQINGLLNYYEIRDGKVYDKEKGYELEPQKMEQLGPYYKTKIESVLVGTKEDNGDLSSVESIKNEIINGAFKTFFGDYNNIGIAKNQMTDYYTNMRCEYFRKGFDKTGKKLNRSLTSRPWCAK